MSARWRIFAAGGLLIIAGSSFFFGRRAEERALTARANLNRQAAAAHATPSPSKSPAYRQLAVIEILSLPFAEFYETLRSAPREAREKWATELEGMPDGPRRTSAAMAFYKLLVQFDPKAAAKTVAEMRDKDLQNLAVSCLVDAAPGFAMRDMAELVLNISLTESGERDYLSDVIMQWIAIDPAAVARFYDEHENLESDGQVLLPDGTSESVNYRDLIADWAAIDPVAAKEWMEKKQVHQLDVFVSGWYLNDPTAAVSYVLAHATEPGFRPAVSGVLSALYLDSKEDAKKFIEALPDERARHDAIHDAFDWMATFGTAEQTGEPERTARAIADWIIQFPPALWKGTLSRTFESWAYSPPEEVFAWIQQQPPEIRDSVAAEYSLPSLDKPKSQAISALLQIADTKLRDQLLMATLRNSDRSFEELKDSIDTALISPTQKEHVLQIITAVQTEKESDQGSEK